ncbi:MAG: hypothetical protein R3B96_08495 [Pirellulaceae bacterium]
MRAVLAMAIKDLTLALRDWAGLFFMLGFPVAGRLLWRPSMEGWGVEKLDLC